MPYISTSVPSGLNLFFASAFFALSYTHPNIIGFSQEKNESLREHLSTCQTCVSLTGDSQRLAKLPDMSHYTHFFLAVLQHRQTQMKQRTLIIILRENLWNVENYLHIIFSTVRYTVKQVMVDQKHSSILGPKLELSVNTRCELSNSTNFNL